MHAWTGGCACVHSAELKGMLLLGPKTKSICIDPMKTVPMQLVKIQKHAPCSFKKKKTNKHLKDM